MLHQLQLKAIHSTLKWIRLSHRQQLMPCNLRNQSSHSKALRLRTHSWANQLPLKFKAIHSLNLMLPKVKTKVEIHSNSIDRGLHLPPLVSKVVTHLQIQAAKTLHNSQVTNQLHQITTSTALILQPTLSSRMHLFLLQTIRCKQLTPITSNLPHLSKGILSSRVEAIHFWSQQEPLRQEGFRYHPTHPPIWEVAITAILLPTREEVLH